MSNKITKKQSIAFYNEAIQILNGSNLELVYVELGSYDFDYVRTRYISKNGSKIDINIWKKNWGLFSVFISVTSENDSEKKNIHGSDSDIVLYHLSNFIKNN